MPARLERISNERTGNAYEEAGIGTRLANEAYVIGAGLAGSVSAVRDSAVHAWESPGTTTLQVGVSTALGLGIGFFATRAGAAGLVARGVAAAAGLSFIDEGIKPWRDAMSAGWNARNDAELRSASSQFSRKLGQFAFDTALMTPGAVGGALAGARLRLALAERPKLSLVKTAEAGGTAVASGSGAAALEGAGIKGMEASEAAVIATDAARKPYRYVEVTPGAKNNKRFDFGVEISDPTLLHGQRNLDHHRSRDTVNTLSAAEQALALPDAELPRGGSVLATIRPDADSVTAMAVLANRNEGRAVNRRLVEAIGRRDRGLKEAPPGESYDDLRDLIDAINYRVRSPHHELHKKVFFVKDALDGSINQSFVAELAQRSRTSRRSLREHIERDMKVQTVIPNKLAMVESFSSSALYQGYDYAPIVILHNKNSHFTRFSVGTQPGSDAGRYMGWALRELRKIEPGWGGRENIFGSPQGTSTKLTPEQVVEVVKRYVDPPTHRRMYYNVVDFLSQARPFRWFLKQA